MRKILFGVTGVLFTASLAHAQAVDTTASLVSAVDLSGYSTAVVTIGTAVLTVVVGLAAFTMIKGLIKGR